VLTNDELSRMVDTNDEWIVSRTGIRERRIAASHEGTASMTLCAAQEALCRAGKQPHEVQLIICATVSPDYQFPAVASLLQSALGTNAGAFDLQAGCTGFVYALITAAQFIQSGAYTCVLVVGGDTLSRLVDWTDRSTCVLFGDAAGAVVLEATDGPSDIVAMELGSDGSNPAALYMDNAGRPTAAAPAGPLPALCAESRYIQMDGRAVFRFAHAVLADTVRRVATAAGWPLASVDLVIPHQANLRIIQAAASHDAALPLERFFVNLDRYGNTSNGSVPVALCEAVDAGALKPGQRLILASFGAGLTWAGIAIHWRG
jgi:3-oxoacyl-[acyl-carrier-protein] synthase-3